MQTFFRLLLLYILFIYGCKTKENPNDLQKANLKGNVKSIREYTLVTKEQKNDTAKSGGDIYTFFDVNGNLLERIFYEEDGKLNSKIKFFYNNGIEIDSIFNADNNLTGHSKTEYDDGLKKSFVSSTILRNILQPTYNEVFKYDNKKNLIEKISFDNQNRQISKTNFKYDERNRLIEERWFNSKNILEWYSKDSNDIMGNRVKSTVFDKDNNVTNTTQYFYDKKGEIVFDSSYNIDRKLSFIHIYSYVYDSHDNWTKRVITTKGTERITLRRIEYYQK